MGTQTIPSRSHPDKTSSKASAIRPTAFPAPKTQIFPVFIEKSSLKQVKIFFFLSTTVTDEKADEYSKGNMENFLNKSYNICKTHSDNYESIMEGIL